MLPTAPTGEGSSLPMLRRPSFPAPLTPCIGRDAELAMLRELLSDPGCRLVTICGGGGIGKTHLTLELGRLLLRDTPAPQEDAEELAFVSLASLGSRAGFDDLMATTIAEALGFTLGGPEAPTAQLRRYLQSRSLLLVLDNLEHLPEAAPFSASLLQDAPGIRILATSRERLRLRGEHVVMLQPLDYPKQIDAAARDSSEQYSAVQLFIATARTVTPDFELDDETRGAVLRIIQLVEGLPLGIELAASWTRILSCGEIADELARNLGVLDATMQDTPARHRSLRAVFDASWELLDAQEQQTLRRLSVFPARFGREAAAAVADATLPLLMALIDKSLLRRLPGEAGAGVRYSVPQVLRQFANEQLQRSGEAASIAGRYAAFYIEQLAHYAPQLRGREQRSALASMADEIDHLRAAWRWASEQPDPAALVRAADSLFHFYDMRSWFSEGATMFGAAQLAMASRQTDDAARLAWSKLLSREAWFTFHLGRQREAQALFERSLATMRRLDAPAELVFPLNYLAVVCSYLGEYERTDELGRESIAFTEKLGDLYGRAVACNILGQAAYDQAFYEVARSWSEQSRAIEQQLGNRWSLAYSLTNLGRVAYVLRDYATARRMFEESLAIRQELGDLRGVSTSLNRLGDVAAAQEQRAEAASLYSQSLALSGEAANPWGIAASLYNLGLLASSVRLDAAAARIFHEALRLALELQALPQLIGILGAIAQLLRRAGDAAAAADARRIVDARPQQLAPAQLVQLQRRVESMFTTQNGEALSLEQAIEQLRRQTQSPVELPAQLKAAQAIGFPAGLTAREVDVLRLVAQGLTDKQVAEQLVVSPRTVTSHLTSIYGKLEVNTRAAATRFAVENGLV